VRMRWTRYGHVVPESELMPVASFAEVEQISNVPAAVTMYEYGFQN